jgi:hypothetical protein
VSPSSSSASAPWRANSASDSARLASIGRTLKAGAVMRTRMRAPSEIIRSP